MIFTLMTKHITESFMEFDQQIKSLSDYLNQGSKRLASSPRVSVASSIPNVVS